jgi:hypothetical protein
MLNLPRVLFGGVRAEGGLGARSLVLTPNAFLVMIFQSFFFFFSVAARLQAQVLEDPALRPTD